MVLQPSKCDLRDDIPNSTLEKAPHRSTKIFVLFSLISTYRKFPYGIYVFRQILKILN